MSAVEGPLRIGIACFPSLGGSGVIATEIGRSLSLRGHRVHFLSYDEPGRGGLPVNIRFHHIALPAYPLPHLSPYPLALASAMAALMRSEGLDLLHVHYALPHATSAYLARQMVAGEVRAPCIVTTLHGTDVTILGSQAALAPILKFSLLSCDGLTVPSAYLRRAAIDGLALPEETAIEVIPNFVDTARFRPRSARRRSGPPVLIHGSNFRPLKRTCDVVRIFAAVRAVSDCELWLLGDGPERPRAEALVHELGLLGSVRFLGVRTDVAEILRRADLFLLPSESEGFGLAALEAMSCGVPVIASRIGGLPEVVTDGKTGFLCEVGDVAAFASAALRLLSDGALYGRLSKVARAAVEDRFQQESMVTRYEAYYRRLLAGAK